MKTCSFLSALMVAFVLTADAQQQKPKIVAEGGTPDDRASARVLYWNTQADAAAGQVAIDYGRPVWKKEYDDPAKFDAMTKGKIWRMGSNYWTILDTDLPLSVSGKKVPIGLYYLGLRRSEQGTGWNLVFIDPGKARKATLDAFQIQKAQVEFEAPMSAAKAETPKEKLTITLSYPKSNIQHVTMKVAWGSLALSTPIDVMVQ
jgi:Protein of unknown function (DUF2911)